MRNLPIVVIGAGASGLAAAMDLVGQGLPVTVLEARDRIGGRIHSIPSGLARLPIELGAEFIHGEENATWELVRSARLRTHKVPDCYWRVVNGKLTRDKRYWDRLDAVFERINRSSPDQDFQSFLDQGWSIDPEGGKLAGQYVEGFHAAPADRIGTHAIALAEAAAERDKGTHQFRIREGYSALLAWLLRQLTAHGVEIWTNTMVRTVHWKPGQVELTAESPAGERCFQARHVVVTLPLGVLKGNSAASVIFEPKLAAKEEAINSLEMGTVVKMTLQFKTRQWPVANFGFIHLDNAALPVWWSDKRGPVITGWAGGGPQAEKLRQQGSDAVLEEALRVMQRLFNKPMKILKEALVASYTYDWNDDPFACGAYSYTPARMTSMPARLAAPLAHTLFFAGEVTDGNGEQGTVHGAIASGRRAAAEILQSIQKEATPPAPARGLVEK